MFKAFKNVYIVNLFLRYNYFKTFVFVEINIFIITIVEMDK